MWQFLYLYETKKTTFEWRHIWPYLIYNFLNLIWNHSLSLMIFYLSIPPGRIWRFVRKTTTVTKAWWVSLQSTIWWLEVGKFIPRSLSTKVRFYGHKNVLASNKPTPPPPPVMVIVQSSCKQYNNRYFKRMTPIAMKSILPSGPLQTKLIIINYNNHDKKPIYK